MVPLCPRAWGTLNHLRKSPYFEKPVPRMGDRQGISMLKATTEMMQEGWRAERPLTQVWRGRCQETLLRRGASLEEKVRHRWGMGKVFQAEGTAHARYGVERGVLWGHSPSP